MLFNHFQFLYFFLIFLEFSQLIFFFFVTLMFYMFYKISFKAPFLMQYLLLFFLSFECPLPVFFYLSNESPFYFLPSLEFTSLSFLCFDCFFLENVIFYFLEDIFILSFLLNNLNFLHFYIQKLLKHHFFPFIFHLISRCFV